MQSTIVRAAWLCLALINASPAAAQDAWRVVNVTTDSAPGWMPSVEQEGEARRVALAFLADLDGGRIAEAYARLSEVNRRNQPFGPYAEEARRFNADAGPVAERRITKITWTKDPANAPGPGVYAAIDLVSRFAKVDRHCGYLMLFQSPAGGAFSVMRQQSALMDNASAQARPLEETDRNWAAVASRACPNYPPQPEASGPAIGYPSVAAALEELRVRKGVKFSTQRGWIIAEDAADRTRWSFAPKDHPAYPAVVKQQELDRNGQASIQTYVHCESGTATCDEFSRSFDALNARSGR